MPIVFPSQAFHLNFLSDFTKYTVVPAVVAAIVVYPILFFPFKSPAVARRLHPTSADGSLIPRNFVKPDVNPREALVDAQGAVFHSVLLLVTLGVLVGTSFTEGVHVWAVTLAGGGLGVIRDFIFDYHIGRRKPEVDTNGIPETGKDAESHKKENLAQAKVSLPMLWRRACHSFPNLTMTLARLPWPLLPFAVGMFILVQSLERLGYISIFATWAARACSSPAASVFFVGSIVAFGLCPLCGTVGCSVFKCKGDLRA